MTKRSKNRGANAVSYPRAITESRMARTEGTVDTVGRSRNQSGSPTLCQTRVTKKKGITRRYAMER